MSNEPTGAADLVSCTGAGGSEGCNRPGEQLDAQSVAALLSIEGVCGVWVEQARDGQSVAVVYIDRLELAAAIPTRVSGMAVSVVGGEPLEAL